MLDIVFRICCGIIKDDSHGNRRRSSPPVSTPLANCLIESILRRFAVIRDLLTLQAYISLDFAAGFDSLLMLNASLQVCYGCLQLLRSLTLYSLMDDRKYW